jgi:hypothetical protein
MMMLGNSFIRMESILGEGLWKSETCVLENRSLMLAHYSILERSQN